MAGIWLFVRAYLRILRKSNDTDRSNQIGAGNGEIADSWIVGSIFMLWGSRAVPDLFR